MKELNKTKLSKSVLKNIDSEIRIIINKARKLANQESIKQKTLNPSKEEEKIYKLYSHLHTHSYY